MGRTHLLLASLGVMSAHASASTLASQPPGAGAGVARWSQLWQDPSPAGNDLDSDAICWQDFTLAAPAQITRIEWWGVGACELGFRIEFWPQDPGTIAYQPLAVFDVGPGPSPVQPTARFDTTAYTVTAGPGGTLHYVLDLETPVALAANNSANPRWFVGIIGLTHQAYYTWNWAQGLGGSTRCYQFLRGSTVDYSFRVLPEGRALVLADNSAPPCPGDTNGDRVVNFVDLNNVLSDYGLTGPGRAGDVNGDNSVNFEDLNIVLSNFGVTC